MAGPGQAQWLPVQIKTFNTRNNAEAWARQVESEIDRGVFVSRVEVESTTLAEVLSRYEREISPSKKGHMREVSVLHTWAKTPLSALPSNHTQRRHRQATRRPAEGCKPATQASHGATAPGILSHVFNIARKE